MVNILLNNTAIQQVRDLKFLGRTMNMSSTVGIHYEKAIHEARNN